MSSAEALKAEIFEIIRGLLGDPGVELTDETRLIGSKSLLTSMKLVELCLAMEDRAAELGFDFDWTSDAAMSKSRSMFRSVGTLVAEFLSQKDAQS